MAAVSNVTWQILLQWRHVKSLYIGKENTLQSMDCLCALMQKTQKLLPYKRLQGEK